MLRCLPMVAVAILLVAGLALVTGQSAVAGWDGYGGWYDPYPTYAEVGSYVDHYDHAAAWAWESRCDSSPAYRAYEPAPAVYGNGLVGTRYRAYRR